MKRLADSFFLFFFLVSSGLHLYFFLPDCRYLFLIRPGNCFCFASGIVHSFVSFSPRWVIAIVGRIGRKFITVRLTGTEEVVVVVVGWAIILVVSI